MVDLRIVYLLDIFNHLEKYLITRAIKLIHPAASKATLSEIRIVDDSTSVEPVKSTFRKNRTAPAIKKPIEIKKDFVRLKLLMGKLYHELSLKKVSPSVVCPNPALHWTPFL